MRKALGRFVPAHFHDPLGLATRLLRTRDPDAIGAMLQAVLGLVLSPLDLVLAVRERSLYSGASDPVRPQLFVCGPPRSGTSLVTQVLLAHLPAAYLSNLSSLFPRAPLVAERLVRRVVRSWRPAFHSYYGRVASLRGPNDSLQLWDRWLGPDRTRIRDRLTAEEGLAMRRFFGAMEAASGRPLVGKNNNLNLQASAVAEALSTSRFLCLTREPLFLGQALLRARRDINGADDVPYGLSPAEPPGTDPIESVCRQVMFHQRGAQAQQALLGPERFRFLAYEEFCADPAATVRLAAEDLGIPDADVCPVPPGTSFTPSRKVRLPEEEVIRMKQTLERVQAEPGVSG